ncbi:hypothetical protein WR25_25420 [Diploscapter pachys]|uniref:Uncharacterized protein n=1 Tax=Diploscapter pachys TaxID=2018661 RepID=A0A2A2JG96_9BILA|nr:hypothetical protein WR25_25420 [Diploscapter pachys]
MFLFSSVGTPLTSNESGKAKDSFDLHQNVRIQHLGKLQKQGTEMNLTNGKAHKLEGPRRDVLGNKQMEDLNEPDDGKYAAIEEQLG